jgi:hypothetical protein
VARRERRNLGKCGKRREENFGFSTSAGREYYYSVAYPEVGSENVRSKTPWTCLDTLPGGAPSRAPKLRLSTGVIFFFAHGINFFRPELFFFEPRNVPFPLSRAWMHKRWHRSHFRQRPRHNEASSYSLEEKPCQKLIFP